MQRFIPLFILVLIFSFLTPVCAQVITCTGSKIHVAGATTVQGILITDTATRIESSGLLKANVFKNSGLINVNTGLIITDTLRLEDGKVQLNSNSTIVIDNTDTLGIKVSNGKLIAPNYGWGVVQWKIGEATTGNKYTVPFVNDSLEDVSMRFEITDPGVGTGGYVEFTTFGTAALDSPNNLVHHPDLTYYPEAAKTVDSNWNFIADRMWRTVAFGYDDKPDANLTFQYADQDAGGSNTLNLSDLMLSKLNYNRWEQVTHAVIDTDFNLITIDTASAYHLWMLHDTIQQNTNTGLSCAEAILIYDTVSFYPTVMTGPFAWFKFTATDTLMRLYVYQGDPAQPFEVDTVRLLGGSCGGGFTSLAHVDTLTSETEVMKEMYLEFDNLVVNTTYYLKLRQGEEKTSTPILAFRRVGNGASGSGGGFTWSGRDECGKRILDVNGEKVLSIGEIIYANCTPCHRPEAGLKDRSGDPLLPLTSYGQCAGRAGNLAAKIALGEDDHHRMPFWKPLYNPSAGAVSSYPHLINERTLSSDEKTAIANWAANLAPLGYEPLPILPPHQSGTQLTSGNVIELDMLSEFDYTPATSSTDDYQNFAFVNTLPYPIYVKKIEFLVAGTPIHHLLVCRDDTDPSHTLQLQNASTTGNSVKGYDVSEVSGGGGSGGQISTKAFTVMGTWAPGGGGNILSFPCDFGIKLVEDQVIVVQMHYPQGTSSKDRSKIRMEYQTTATRNIYSIWIGPNDANYAAKLDVPADGIANVNLEEPVANLANTINNLYTSGGGAPLFNPIPGTVTILGVLPHMHLRGEKFDMYIENNQTHAKTGLLNIVDYDFHWQEMYRLKQPLVFATSSTGSPAVPDYSFHIDAVFNNQCSEVQNLNRHVSFTDNTCSGTVPCSTSTVYGTHASCQCCTRLGFNTYDEMCVGLVMWTPYQSGDENLILDPEEPGYVQANAAIDKYLCMGESYSLGDPNAVSGPTYIWSPTTDLSSATIANPICSTTTATPTSYILTATKDGCSAKDTIWVGGSCTPYQFTYLSGGTTLTKTLEYNSPVSISQICTDIDLANPNACYFNYNLRTNVIDLSVLGYDIVVKINSTLTIDNNYTIKNCRNISTGFGDAGGFRFGANGSISVLAGKNLRIDNSYLSACGGEMWKGIYVPTGSFLNIFNNSIIADAQTAVGGGGIINLRNSRFYRNLTAVNVPAGTNYQGMVDCCDFKCDAEKPLMNYLLGQAYCGKRPKFGIQVSNLKGIPWSISSYPPGSTSNTFDGLNCGIAVYGSNVRVNQNIFKKIQKHEAYAESGKGVYALGTTGSAGYPVFNNLFVETNSLSTSPAFSDNEYGVYVSRSTAFIRNNNMAETDYGIYADRCNPGLIIDRNYIEDTQYGITLNRVNTSRLTNNIIPRIRVGQNEVRTVNLSGTYGIKQIESSAISATYTPVISGNELYNASQGIYLERCYGTKVYNNDLFQTTGSNQIGVYALSSKAIIMEENTFSGALNNGVVFDESYGNICGNTFNNISLAAMKFEGDCNQSVGTKLTGNVIGACKYGIHLASKGAINGEIGKQGNLSQTHGNIFNGPFNNTDYIGGSWCQTYCSGITNGGSSAFRVHSTNLEPRFNGADFLSNPITTGSAGTADSWICGGTSAKNSQLVERDSSESAQMESHISLFPNPANSTVEIIINGGIDFRHLEAYDMVGRLIKSIQINSHTTLNVKSWKPGIYILKFSNFRDNQTLRLVVSG